MPENTNGVGRDGVSDTPDTTDCRATAMVTMERDAETSLTGVGDVAGVGSAFGRGARNVYAGSISGNCSPEGGVLLERENSCEGQKGNTELGLQTGREAHLRVQAREQDVPCWDGVNE